MPAHSAGPEPGSRRYGSATLGFAFHSRRTLAVTLLSFSSGLPLGLIWYAIPDWMRSAGFDIRIVGLTTLAHAPWTFKVVWAPLMDRFAPPWLDRRRGWIALTQLALFALTAGLAGLGDHPDLPWVLMALAFAIAFASASQDVVIDAYAVEVLRPDEQGVAVGARTAAYRLAMFVAGAAGITLAGWFSWPAVNAGLASLYILMIVVTRFSPGLPDTEPPPRSLREAVWLPFVGFMGRHRALEILAFVLLYKLADNLAQSLQRPFLFDRGYSALDRGLALGTVGILCTVGGTLIGGVLTDALGLGRCLWLFGILQLFSNLGFVLLSVRPVDVPLMYGAMGFEALTTGMGMGAFGVLLLRLTQKRFSATQYALFSSLFALPRVVAGPLTGVVVHELGWTTFFWLTMLAGIPGLVFLARFVPPGTVDPRFDRDPTPASADAPYDRVRGAVVPVAPEGRSRGPAVAAGLVGAAAAWGAAAWLAGPGDPGAAGLLPDAVEIRHALLADGWPSVLRVAGGGVFGVACALLVAAARATRR